MTSPAVVNPRHAPPGRVLPGAVPSRPRRPSLTVVPTAHPRTRRPAVALSLAMVVVFATLFAGAVVHSMLVSGQAHLDRVTTQTRSEAEQLEVEQLRLASLQSPERITREAERLGMVPGGPDNWLAPDGSTGTDQPATDEGETGQAGNGQPGDRRAEPPASASPNDTDGDSSSTDPNPTEPPAPVGDPGELAGAPTAPSTPTRR